METGTTDTLKCCPYKTALLVSQMKNISTAGVAQRRRIESWLGAAMSGCSTGTI